MIRFKILFTHLVVFTVAVLSQASTNLPPNDQQMAYGQRISCTFTATIVRITRLETTLPPTNKLKGYLIDKDPKWELELDVLEHKNKIPFQPGLRKCYIADVQSVFNTQADKVQGQYTFSFVWNIRVPGRAEFELFRGRKESVAEPVAGQEKIRRCPNGHTTIKLVPITYGSLFIDMTPELREKEKNLEIAFGGCEKGILGKFKFVCTTCGAHTYEGKYPWYDKDTKVIPSCDAIK